MYVVYQQKWKDGRTSYHRSPSDILEFARNHDPVPERRGAHTSIRKADFSAVKALEGTLGSWRYAE